MSGFRAVAAKALSEIFQKALQTVKNKSTDTTNVSVWLLHDVIIFNQAFSESDTAFWLTNNID